MPLSFFFLQKHLQNLFFVLKQLVNHCENCALQNTIPNIFSSVIKNVTFKTCCFLNATFLFLDHFVLADWGKYVGTPTLLWNIRFLFVLAFGIHLHSLMLEPRSGSITVLLKRPNLLRQKSNTAPSPVK